MECYNFCCQSFMQFCLINFVLVKSKAYTSLKSLHLPHTLHSLQTPVSRLLMDCGNELDTNRASHSPRSDCSSHSFLLRLFHKFFSPSLLLVPPLLLSLSHAHDCNPARGFAKQTSQSAACRTKKKAGAMGQSQLCRRMKRSQHSMELSISDMNTDGNCAVDGFH